LTDQQRMIPQLAGLGQDFYDFDYTAMDTGTAANVPYPASAQGGDSWFTQVTNAAKNLLPAVYAANAQRDLNEINLERARKGMPALSPSYMAATAPRFNVGMAPDTQDMLLWGGIAIAAVLAFGMFSRR
jgi:hypothetical protein